MKKLILTILFIIWFFILNTYCYWEEQIKNWNIKSTDIQLDSIEFDKNILIWENIRIDLSKQKKYLEEKYNTTIIFKWISKWEIAITWDVYNKIFENFWDRKITLHVFKVINSKEHWDSIDDQIDSIWDEKKELLIQKDFNFFVYKKSIAIIFEKELWKKIEEYKSKAKEAGILVYNIGTTSIWEIWKFNYLENITKYRSTEKILSDYITIWWSKDFLFDILSKLNIKIKNQKLNIVLISSYNIDILNKLLQNIISNKKWIDNIILLDEVSTSQILKQTDNILLLEKEIKNNNYQYINLNNTWKIHNFLFISKFVNNLSNKWFSINNIYIILIIPFILIWISIFKHILWLTPIWILIPTSITILLLKLWFIPTFIILLTFLFLNLSISKIIWKYKLHYTPKISLLTIINIIAFIIIMNILEVNQLIKINMNDIIFIILFILIAEKLITVIISKDFSEYQSSLFNTILFSIFSYAFFTISSIKSIILAYPELILILIPIVFMLGKFTWLRVTEYFRFKEVIKSIEE